MELKHPYAEVDTIFRLLSLMCAKAQWKPIIVVVTLICVSIHAHSYIHI